MFPISTIKRYLAKRREYKGRIKLLKCPLCGKKFWGRLPTSIHAAAFSAHCPRKGCNAPVDESCIIESRQQKIARWGRAIAAAGWAVVKYPIQPFAATKKIVALETRMKDRFTKIEDKIDLTVSTIGGIIKGLVDNKVEDIIIEIIEVDQSRIKGIRGHFKEWNDYIYKHSVKYINGPNDYRIRLTGVYLSPKMKIVCKNELMEFITKSKVTITEAGRTIIDVNLISLLSGNRLKPITFQQTSNCPNSIQIQWYNGSEYEGELPLCFVGYEMDESRR